MTVTLLLAAGASGCAGLPSQVERPVSRSFNAPEQTALGRLVQARRSQAGARSDSAFKLLDSEDLAFTARLALISGAQRSLDLQYYAIHADASTEILLQRLRDAARRGVRVRLLLDDFNTVGADAQVLRLGFEPNVEIRLFNPIPGSRASLLGRVLGSLDDVERMQKRMHNKLFLADSAMGITGGRNLGDEYFGAGDGSNFVDLDVLAWGRVVRDMAASFDRYWNNELAYPAQSLLSRDDLEALRQPPQPPAGGAEAGAPALAALAGAATPNALTPSHPNGALLPQVAPTPGIAMDRQPLDLVQLALTWAPALLLVDQPGKIGPGDDEADAGDTVVDGLLDLMQKATREVVIVTPYFVPGKQMMAVLQKMRERGVRIRVLTNSLASNDAPAAHAGYSRYRHDLLRIGVELHEMRAVPLAASDREARRRLAGIGSGSSGLGPGGSKSGRSRASLHTKAVMIDGRLSVIGSMNLDLRSQRQNSEVALVIRSTALAREAVRQVEATLGGAAYRVTREGGSLRWRAPPGVSYGGARSEPGASIGLRFLVRVLGPLAPEEML